MKFCFLALYYAILAAAKAPAASASGASSGEMPWTDLQSSLSDASVLLLPDSDSDSIPSKWAEECAALWNETSYSPSGPFVVSQYSLNAAPAGLCSNTLSCAFRDCQWPYAPQTDVEYSYDEFVKNVPDTMNLPQAVMYPKVTSDVVAAVAFAREHGLKVSVKAGGNSYTGAHTEKDSLMLYMGRQYQSFSDKGVTPCDANAGSGSAASNHLDISADDAIDQMPCAVAASRGKPGVITIGGGELFIDAYANALEEKDETGTGDKNKYHLVGGGTPTVSPNGWTFGGGLSGNTGMRMFGYGADQVVQLEMVLPLGWHVKFGPSAWEDDSSLDFPRVTEVRGWCRVEETWTDCPDEPDVDFFELWHAVRGGGGGAYGVVLSTTHQVHPRPGDMELTYLGIADAARPLNLTEEAYATLLRGYIDFHHDFFFFPERLESGVTADMSNLFGNSPNMYSFNLGNMIPGVPGFLFSQEGGTKALTDAWAEFFDDSQYNLGSNLADLGVSDEEMNALKAGIYAGPTYTHYVDFLLNGQNPDVFPYFDQVPEGKPVDGPSARPQDGSGTEAVSILVPKKLLEFDGPFREWLVDQILANGWTMMPYMLGGKTATSHDGTAAIPQTQREAAYTVGVDLAMADEVLGLIHGDADYEGSYPGGQQYNHISAREMGPQKSDWTKSCPPNESEEVRADECFSLQEGVWGTEGLARLEAIKAVVDPDSLFMCSKCVGYKRTSAEEPSTDSAATTTTTTEGPPTETTTTAAGTTQPPEIETDSAAPSVFRSRASAGGALFLAITVTVVSLF